MLSRDPAGPVVDTTQSPYGTIRPLPISAVKITDAFWSPRIALNRDVTIPSQLAQCKATGRIDNFRRASGKIGGDFQGIYFNDSDVYKWAEAASWSLATSSEPHLDAELDAVIAEIAAAQQPDGYLNTYFMFERAKDRFTNLKDMHEIYCAGHLFQAAAAHFRATGKRSLLSVAYRLADHLYEVFGPGRRVGACGHEEAEMGLVELYRIGGDSRYLELAGLMIEARGKTPPVLGGAAYHQDHAPFTEQNQMIGHAVRHLYLCCGAADVVAETGNAAYVSALEALWNNFTLRQMYVTGGAGARYEGESFGADYELPNERAYTETCAAIASVMWNWRMLMLTGLPQYSDIMELTLYNAVLPGLSLDGKRYFYENPLADRGKHRRQEWFGCACCPPNVARMLASLSGYVYGVSSDAVYVNLYVSSQAEVHLAGGDIVCIRQESDYPWSGEITISVDAAPAREIEVQLRIPFWVDPEEVTVLVNGVKEAGTPVAEGGKFLPIRREWRKGDVVLLSLPMPVERIECHPHVTSNRGRVALQRGPLIYCVENVDNPGADPWDLSLPDSTGFNLKRMEIEGYSIVALEARAKARRMDDWSGALYAPYAPEETEDFVPAALTAIPYYAWANRDAGPMQVWLPTLADE